MSAPETGNQLLEELFRAQLDGEHRRSRSPDETKLQRLEFRTITNERWHVGNTVLMGDAAHTTSFTIGSGTRLAFENAMALAAGFRGRRSHAHLTADELLVALGDRRDPLMHFVPPKLYARAYLAVDRSAVLRSVRGFLMPEVRAVHARRLTRPRLRVDVARPAPAVPPTQA